MYMKAVYLNSIYAGTITDPAAVLRDFFQDISARRPSSITENKTRVFISFKDDGNLYAYTLPVNYKKHVAEV